MDSNADETISKQNSESAVIDSQNKLNATTRARIERNRQKALLLRQSRLVEKSNKQKAYQSGSASSGYSSKIIDSGGGFFIEEDESSSIKSKVKRVEEPAPALAGDKSTCVDCGMQFLDSYLLKTFGHSSCDKCKDMDEIHKLITRTEAKTRFQITDVDLDRREPPLSFFSRKNPHNSRWGEMKLYLLLQVEQRALEVHGTLEEIENVREQKNIKKEIARKKKYKKTMDNLRKEVRSSLYTRDTHGHEHIYGPESCIDSENDIWKKKCKMCDHELTYEKM